MKIRALLGAAFTIFLSGAANADRLPAVGSTLGTGLCTVTGSLRICAGGVADAMLVSAFLKLNSALGTPASGDASNLTNIPVANAKSGSILPIANLTALPASNFFAGDAGGRPIAASATGDFGCGTAAAGFISCTVTGLQGRAVDSAAPADTNVLAWNASTNKWKPTATTSGGSGTVNGGTTPQAAYYATSAPAVSGASGVTFPNANSISVGTPSGSAPSSGIVDVAVGYQINGVPMGQIAVGTSQTFTVAQWVAGTTFIVATPGQTLTSPLSSTLPTSGAITIQTIGQSVTIQPNGADAVCGIAGAGCGSTGASAVIPPGSTALVTTDGTGKINVPTRPLTGALATVTPGAGVATAAANDLSAAGGFTTTIASNSTALGTGAISSGTCATVVTATATNTLTTDVVTASFNGDPTGVTGYIPATAGMLSIVSYPTSGNVNFKVCNNTAGSITPGAITLNWRVVR